jgi:acetoin utilization deacetylase AcuC-like enzyme
MIRCVPDVRTGLVTDARFTAHRAPTPRPGGADHPERPERLTAIEAAIDAAGLRARTIPVAARPATRAELEAAHQPAFLDALEHQIAGKTGWLDPDTYFCPASWETAVLAAGATVELATQISDGRLDNGLALVRPPGHHATAARAMGFCLINNVAVAARVLQHAGKRVAIFDWDLHHGNGTEDIFAADPAVLYASMHEWPQYPGTGPAEFRGSGNIVNVPLPAGTDDTAWLEAFHEYVLPALKTFAPDVLMVSAGFDAHRDDPLGGLQLTEAAYVAVTKELVALQPRLCAVLEGGYDLGAIARSTVGVLGVLVGP